MKIFTKQKFIESEGECTYKHSAGWVDACDGAVARNGAMNGSDHMSYICDDDWCVKVEPKDVYKKGDKVLIIGKRRSTWNSQGKMDKYMNTVQEIEDVFDDNYVLKGEDERHPLPWSWTAADFVGAVIEEKKHVEKENDDMYVKLYFKGMRTIAEMYNGDKLCKTATAKCNPSDIYDRAEGAKIAVERLFEKKKEELKGFTGKVVCTENAGNFRWWTVGKIYEVKNGIIVDDCGPGIGDHPFSKYEEGFISVKFLKLV